MDSSLVRLVCAAVAVVLLGVIILRRKGKNAEE
jgi:hypothetical protein